jgi:hypothetical protein
MLVKIISGGQTGADQAALWAAEELGLKTGGMMPAGYRTDTGRDEALAIRFKLSCHISENYQPRTWHNVNESDGTLVFGNPTSPGCKLTLKFCIQLNRPHIGVQWPIDNYIVDDEYFRKWLIGHDIKVLNVAGNRESKNPGIFVAAKAFLILNLKELSP